MDLRQKLKFIWGTGVPPTLESFEGRVAERHVENIKSIRSIGMKRYIEACHTLSAEEILLRQKVYNLFIGPGIFCSGIRLTSDCFYWPPDHKIEDVSSWFGRGICISWNGLTEVDVIPFPFTLVHSILTYPLNLDYDIRREQGENNLERT